MAALVLGAAGSVLGGMFGGPLGAALGQLAGSALGNALFPQKVEGPRLSDLKLQSAQYGEFITIFWGTMRFAGKVMWQTDLVEHSETSGGKGGPETTTYSYSCSFAILLADRTGMDPIIAVPEIWADGRLVHDTSNYTSESALPFTLYYGTETQMPDPTIELDKGAGNVPAHRGLAYIVFTDLPMGDYGNRIPNFSFLVTDQAAVDVALHLTKQNDYPLPVQWYEAFSTPTGIGHPYITAWDTADSGKIVIKNLGTLPGHDYNSIDLTYSGTTNHPGEAGHPPLVTMRIDNPAVENKTFFYVGLVLISDVYIDVYVYHNGIIQAGTQNAALIADSAWNEDDVNHRAAGELAESAGVTTGEYIKGAVVQQDKKAMFVFTNTLSGSGLSPTKWYKLRDGAVEDQGTIIPASFPIPGSLYGSAAGTYAPSFNCAMFENNGLWMWMFTGAGSANVFHTFHIDPVTKVMQYNVTGGAAGGFDITSEIFTSTSIYVLSEGFAGAVTVDQLAVCSRFPVFSAEGIPLSDLVSNLCVRSGLDAATQVNVESLEDDLVPGYLLSNQASARSAIGPLQTGYMFDAVESDLTMKFVKRGGDSIITIPDDDLAAATYGEDLPDALHVTRVPEDELPQQVNVDFLNLDEAYQQGHAYDRREVTNSELQQTVGLPIAMTPIKARQISQQLLYNQWIERERFQISLPRKYAYLEPTDVITVMSRRMRITKEDQSQAGVIKFDGVAASTRTWVAGPTGVAGSGFTAGTTSVDQPTDLALLDLPLLQDGDAQPGFYAAFAGQTSTQWKGAALYKSSDGGINYTQINTQTSSDTFGSTTTTLATFTGGNIFDELNSVTVELTRGAGTLESTTELLVLNGANLCVIGSELVQFKNATLTGTRQYRLYGLLRGRYGTEWAMGLHTSLDTFVLLPIKDYTLSGSELGIEKTYKAVTLGKTLASAEATPFTAPGIRVKPLSPVYLSGGSDASGNVTINWIRRTRVGSLWRDSSDASLGESSESYVLQIWNSTYTVCARTVTGIAAQTYQYTSAMQVTDFGANQLTIYVTVGQVGTYTYGYEAQGTAPGIGASNTAPLIPVVPYTGPPSSSGGTPNDNHMANFRGLFNAGGRDRQLAYMYGQLTGATIVWYISAQQLIREEFFGGDSWSRALWIQNADQAAGLDADPTTPRYPNEASYLHSLAAAVN